MIYFATALFSVAERDFALSVVNRIESLGCTVYYPWRDAGDEQLKLKFSGDIEKVNAEIVRLNLIAVRCCRFLVAVVEGPDVDSGTAMEIGFAAALGKRIFCLRTDFRTQGETIGPVNIMISRVAAEFHISVDALIDSIIEQLRSPSSVVPDLPDFYNSIAHEYGDRATHRFTANMRDAEERHTRQSVDGNSYDVALDVGCGDGNFLCYVPAAKRIGVDSSVEMLKRHWVRLRSARFLLTDCRDLLVESSSVDIVHSSFLLDHLEDTAGFFQEVARVLRSAGVFLLSLYSPEHILKQRPHLAAFEYKTRDGQTLLVPSNFVGLKNLREQLEMTFRVERFQQLVAQEIPCPIDYYILQKR